MPHDRCEQLRQLCGLSGSEPTPAQVAGAAARLRRSGLPADVRLAFVGNLVVGALPQHAEVACALDGILATSFVGDFGQEMQEVLAPDSRLREFAPDVTLLCLSLRTLAPRVFGDFTGLTADERTAERRRILDHVLAWLEAARRATPSTLVIANFVVPSHPAAGIADLKDAAGEIAFHQQLNLDLLERLREEPRAHLLDLDRLAGRFGKEQALDTRLALLARIEWSEAFIAEIALELRRYVAAALGRTRKCLVLDLDNTLWGGILGEDGADGLHIGPGHPEGEAFLAVQQAALALRRRGVLLALASKNDAADVAAAFQALPHMALTLSDFAAAQVNWQPKADNLRRIAEELNIGLDSLAFADDSPAECSLVRAMVPEVLVVELSGDPAGHAERLRRLACFEMLEVTEQDRQRAQSYQENRARAEQRQAVGRLEDYLAGLETRVVIRPAVPGDLTRVHQLVSKTNQFNLTTERLAAGAVQALLDRDRYDLRIADVADRFGALGSVGLFLVEQQPGGPHIRLFLLSCRALGRGVETAMMNALKQRWLSGPACRPVTALYCPSPRNQQVAGFYETQGFAPTGETADGHRRYALSPRACRLAPCPALAVTVVE